MDGRGPHQRQHRAQGARHEDGQVHGQLRPLAHADARRAAHPGAHAGAGEGRGADRSSGAAALLHPADQHDRPAGGYGPGRLRQGRAAGRAAQRRPASRRSARAQGVARLRAGQPLGRQAAAAGRRARASSMAWSPAGVSLAQGPPASFRFALPDDRTLTFLDDGGAERLFEAAAGTSRLWRGVGADRRRALSSRWPGCRAACAAWSPTAGPLRLL